MKKSFTVIMPYVLLLFLCFSVSGYTPDLGDLTYKGDVVFSVDREYSAGETMRLNITASNLEDVTISDGYLVIELVEGAQTHEYPSQGSDTDNVFYEKVLGNISIPPHSEKTISFEYILPADLRAGNHRLEVYFETGRTPVIGISSILIAPQYQSFNTSGSGDFPLAKILRTKTVFQNSTGPVGFVSGPGSSIKGEVYVKSDSDSPLAGLSLVVTVCEWSDAICDGGAVWNNSYPVLIPSNGTGMVPVVFAAPDKPGVYSVRLELKDQNQRTLSLYRSRTVVEGPTGRIRRMDSDKSYLKANESGRMRVIISAAGDGSSLKKATLKAWVLDDSGKRAFIWNTSLPEMSMENNGLLETYIDYFSPNDMDAMTLCASIESAAGEKYDDYCYKMDSQDMPSETVVSANWIYDRENSSLEVRLCASDALGRPVRSSVSLVIMGSEGRVYYRSESMVLDPCMHAVSPLDRGNYTLVVGELESGRQQTYEISVDGLIRVCGDSICTPGEKGLCCRDCGCDAGYYCLAEGCAEVKATAVEETLPHNPLQESRNGNSLLLGLGVLAVAGAVFIALGRKKRGGAK